MNCWKYKNNSANWLRNQKSDFKHYNLKCWKSNLALQAVEKQKDREFFLQFDKRLGLASHTYLSKLLFYLLYGVVLLDTQAAIRRCSTKEVLLEISHNPKKNTCVGVSFIKKDSDPDLFLWILWNFLRILFYGTPPVAAFRDIFFTLFGNIYKSF